MLWLSPQTLLPFPDADSGVLEVAHLLHNFDIPEVCRCGKAYMTAKSWPARRSGRVIGDVRNRRYYYWTEFNRRMRLVNLSKLDFGGTKIQRTPPDPVRREDIEDRTQDFS